MKTHGRTNIIYYQFKEHYMITTSLSINFTHWLSGQDWLSDQRPPRRSEVLR